MTLTEIRTKIRYLLGEISTSDLSEASALSLVNDYYNKAVGIVLLEMGGWEVNGEEATANLVSGQKEYVLPTDLLVLKQIELNLNDETNGWIKAQVFDMSEKGTALANDGATPGFSTRVRVFDNSLFLEDAPTSNVTGGLKIYYSKEATELSGANDQPNLAEHCQDYLVYGPCRDYSIRINDDAGVNRFDRLLNEMDATIRLHYSNRLPAVKPRIKPRFEKYN